MKRPWLFFRGMGVSPMQSETHGRDAHATSWRIIVVCALLLFGFGGVCHRDKFDYRMVLQPKYNPEDMSDFWVDRASARSPVPGTVPIDGFPNEELIYAVRSERSNATAFPFQLTRRDLEQGQRQFGIFCSPCHGALGDGNGMIPQRGFTHPPSFYLKRLRDAAPGHFYDVITNGYGAMYSYNERVSSDDRWRIAGYIRALQLSNPADTGIPDTPPTQRK